MVQSELKLGAASRASHALWLVASLLFSVAFRGAAAQCTTNSPYVGFTGELTEMEHDVSGRVRILDDCTMQITGFTYDGKAPAAYWWGAPSTGNAAIRREGRRIADAQVTAAYDGSTITVKLEDGVSWDQFPVVLLWCEEFYADFGHVQLKAQVTERVPEPEPKPEPAASPSPPPPARKPKPPPPTSRSPPPAMPAAAPAPAPAAESSILGLANCLELIPGIFNLHWETVDSQIMIGLEGLVDGDNRWMGFGFSAPNSTDVTMPGADAIVAGMVNGSCFALDYNLQIRSQCSYTEASGVCPDTALSRDPATNQVEVLECYKVGGVMAVTVMRPIAASDSWDWSWPLDGSGFPVWAMGPVSEGSNASSPVVLYHRLQLPGASEETIVHAPVGQNYRIDLSAPSVCTPLLTAAAAGQGSAPAPGPAAEARVPPAVLEGVTEFDIVTGDNPNYPNPPGWGISYHINGKESPVLKVVRGNTYTFKVMAGPNHPLYLTSSIVGGGSYSSYAGEAVYGGGEDAHGTPEEPYVLTWTPDASTPDLLYYQCTVHQKLGWQVQVADA